MADARVHGLLLAGGASRRMQRDKAGLEYAGEPQLLRAWQLLTAVTGRAFVSVGPAQRDDPLRARFPRIVDAGEAAGPMAGILSAQGEYPGIAWLVIACDLPRLDAATLTALLAMRDPSKDVTAYLGNRDALPEPLCAVWEPSSHSVVKRHCALGDYSLRRALRQLEVQALPAPDEALDNVNTPEEFERMRHRLESAQ